MLWTNLQASPYTLTLTAKETLTLSGGRWALSAIVVFGSWCMRGRRANGRTPHGTTPKSYISHIFVTRTRRKPVDSAASRDRWRRMNSLCVWQRQSWNVDSPRLWVKYSFQSPTLTRLRVWFYDLATSRKWERERFMLNIDHRYRCCHCHVTALCFGAVNVLVNRSCVWIISDSASDISHHEEAM